MIGRACECRACRARTERDFWRIIGAAWQPSDEETAEREAFADHRVLCSALARGLASIQRGEEDGA